MAARRRPARARALGRGRDALGLRRAAHAPADGHPRAPSRPRRAALARAEVAAEVARIHGLWSDCLAASGGPFLFGGFSIADAFFAPVVTRFRTYAIPLPALLARYSDAVFALPAMQQWVAAAAAEPETLDD